MTEPTTIEAQALLFDMDGTLVDSAATSARVWHEWAAGLGLDGDAVLAAAHGRRTLDTVRLFTADEATARAAARWIEAEEVAAGDGTTAIPGARTLLASLPATRWAVVTSAGCALALRRLTAAGLPLPEVLVTAEDVEAGKPDPQGYLLAARRLGADPARCIVFEDTFAGHESARRAGMRSIDRRAQAHGHTGPILSLPDYRGIEATAADGGVRLQRDIVRPPAE